MRVLVTRAHEDATRTAARLAAAGHEALVAPVIEIVPTKASIPDEVFDAVLATSVHALNFVEHLPSALAGAPWLVVGERLARVLADRQLGPPEVSAPDAAALISAIDERYPGPFRFLYLTGRDRKPDLERELRNRGHEIVAVETYAAEPTMRFDPPIEAALRSGALDAVLHFSRRSAELFIEQARTYSGSEELRHIAISADAAGPLQAQGWRVEVAATPDEEAMLASLA